MRRATISLLIFFAFVLVITLGRHAIDKTTTTTTTTSTTTTTIVTGTTTTTASTSGDTCKAADFVGTYNEGEGAAGTVYASVTITKNTPGSCTLEGWPLLTLQDHLGAVITSSLIDVPDDTDGFKFDTAKANAAPTLLTLSDNQSTTFSLAYSDVQTGTIVCPSATTLSVQFEASGASIPVTPTYPVQPCNAGSLWVSPFY